MKVLFAFIVVAALAVTTSAAAHPLAPVGLTIHEDNDAIEVELKRARVQPKGAAFVPRCPADCSPLAPTRITDHVSHVIEARRWRCASPLVGATFGVDGLSEAGVDAVVRVRFADGHEVAGLLDDSAAAFIVPARTPTPSFFVAYFRSGLEHLAVGFDHILVVLGLVLLLRKPRHVLGALTAFTLGHGLSLGAATLDIVRIPSAWAELAIAATLVWLAAAMAKDRDEAVTRPWLYVSTLAVGLVHGLGFAAAFESMGLTGGSLPVALAAFHIGIEVAQLVIVALALIAIRASRQLSFERFPIARQVPSYAVGSIATCWVIERALMLA